MWIVLTFAFLALGFLLIAFGGFETTTNLFALMCFFLAIGTSAMQDYPVTNKSGTPAEKIEKTCMCECTCEE